MTQSGYIAAALLAGFVLYLAARGRLNAYSAVLWGPTAAPKPSALTQATNSASDNAMSANSIMDKLGTAAEVAALFGG